MRWILHRTECRVSSAVYRAPSILVREYLNRNVRCAANSMQITVKNAWMITHSSSSSIFSTTAEYRIHFHSLIFIWLLLLLLISYFLFFENLMVARLDSQRDMIELIETVRLKIDRNEIITSHCTYYVSHIFIDRLFHYFINQRVMFILFSFKQIEMHFS